MRVLLRFKRRIRAPSEFNTVEQREAMEAARKHHEFERAEDARVARAKAKKDQPWDSFDFSDFHDIQQQMYDRRQSIPIIRTVIAPAMYEEIRRQGYWFDPGSDAALGGARFYPQTGNVIIDDYDATPSSFTVTQLLDQISRTVTNYGVQAESAALTTLALEAAMLRMNPVVYVDTGVGWPADNFTSLDDIGSIWTTVRAEELNGHARRIGRTHAAEQLLIQQELECIRVIRADPDYYEDKRPVRSVRASLKANPGIKSIGHRANVNMHNRRSVVSGNIRRR